MEETRGEESFRIPKFQGIGKRGKVEARIILQGIRMRSVEGTIRKTSVAVNAVNPARR